MTKKLTFLLVIAFSLLWFTFYLKSLPYFLSSIKKYDVGVYLFLTGVNNKIANVVKYDFNYHKNSDYNHIGFLIKDKNQTYIIDVKPDKIKLFPFLKLENFDDFIKYYDNQLEYLGIWKLSEITKIDLMYFIDENKPITYDYKFDNRTDNKLYCSEFVAKILKKVYDNKVNFILLEKKLSSRESFLVGKKNIEYYPVDFFVKDDKFEFVSEWSK